MWPNSALGGATLKTLTNCIAGVGLCWPQLGPAIAKASEGASAIVPILSAIWLATQICKAWKNL